jgi:hypothetical protein
MTDFEFDGNWREVRHPFHGYAVPPLRGCGCAICVFTRMSRAYCRLCGNLGSTLDPCIRCGRGDDWPEWGTMTDDVATGA